MELVDYIEEVRCLLANVLNLKHVDTTGLGQERSLIVLTIRPSATSVFSS